MELKFIIFFIVVFAFFSCGSADNTNAKRISQTKMDINTSKKAFNPESMKIICDSLKFEIIVNANKIEKLVVFKGIIPMDTILLAPKKLISGAEKEIIKADLDFDGQCEIIIPDKKNTKGGGAKHYYFMLDPETRKFTENNTLPAYIGSFKLDIKNQRVKLYCPNQDCFAYYKYGKDKKFELVQGEFKSAD